MPAIQRRLFPDPKPLVEEFGADFFRQLPAFPGVYLMHDVSGVVLYVGKAKNVRHRLESYRVANPERMPRRTLRLLRLVKRISWECCANEFAALQRESELLLSLKPRFNRAGVWRGPERFLAWRFHHGTLELAMTTEDPGDSWFSTGPFGAQVRVLRHALVRLFWCVLQSQRGLFGMPPGWFEGWLPEIATIKVARDDFVIAEEAARVLQASRQGTAEELARWFEQRIGTQSSHERLVLDADLEYVATRLPRVAQYRSGINPELRTPSGFPVTKLFAF